MKSFIIIYGYLFDKSFPITQRVESPTRQWLEDRLNILSVRYEEICELVEEGELKS